MRLRSPIGNEVELRISEVGLVRIYQRHGWKQGETRRLGETMTKSAEAFRDFNESIEKVKETIRNE